jgi:hypothetical protein
MWYKTIFRISRHSGNLNLYFFWGLVENYVNCSKEYITGNANINKTHTPNSHLNAQQIMEVNYQEYMKIFTTLSSQKLKITV